MNENKRKGLPRTEKSEIPCPFCRHTKTWFKSGKEVCSKCSKVNKGYKTIKNKHGKERLVAIV